MQKRVLAFRPLHMKTIEYVFIEHFFAAGQAALFFFFGAFAAIPMIRWNLSGCQTVFGWVLRTIYKLFGSNPGLLRLASTIFFFNATAMFVYLSLGVHQVVPKFISFLTGFTLALCFSLPQKSQRLFEFPLIGPEERFFRSWAHIVCAAATPLIELPCFFYTIGMGITLGEHLTSGQIYYLTGLEVRAVAYLTTVLPLLLVSAICETIAIRAR